LILHYFIRFFSFEKVLKSDRLLNILGLQSKLHKSVKCQKSDSKKTQALDPLPGVCVIVLNSTLLYLIVLISAFDVFRCMVGDEQCKWHAPCAVDSQVFISIFTWKHIIRLRVAFPRLRNTDSIQLASNGTHSQHEKTISSIFFNHSMHTHKYRECG